MTGGFWHGSQRASLPEFCKAWDDQDDQDEPWKVRSWLKFSHKSFCAERFRLSESDLFVPRLRSALQCQFLNIVD